MINEKEKITSSSIMQQVDKQKAYIKLPGCRLSRRRRKRIFSDDMILSRSIKSNHSIKSRLNQIKYSFKRPKMLLAAIFLMGLHFGHSIESGIDELTPNNQQVVAQEPNNLITKVEAIEAQTTTIIPSTQLTTDNPILTTNNEFNDLAINERGDETNWLGLATTTTPTTASESPQSPLSTTSSFDRFVLGNDENGASLGSSNLSDVDYILANATPTGAPDSSSPVTTQADQVNIDNGHQSNGGSDESSAFPLNAVDEHKVYTSTEAHSNERHQIDDSNLISASTSGLSTTFSASIDSRSSTTTTSPKIKLDSELDKANVAINASVANETLNSQLVRNRKSSEMATTKLNETSNSIQPEPVKSSSSNTSEPKNPYSIGSFVEYDDFDLDYQLKLNNTSSSLSPLSQPSLLSDISELNGQNLNKRDNNLSVKEPDWTALIRQQPHIFSPTNASNYFHPLQQQHRQQQQTPPMIPSLLTVKSTQLTSQELNKIRPQLLFYQDQDSSPNSFLQEQNQAFANGDLIATASAAGSPLSSGNIMSNLVNNNPGANQRGYDWITSKDSISNKTEQSMINLMNGSPILRPNNQYGSLFEEHKQLLSNQTETNRLLSELNNGSVTTIVVDNSTPTEAPSTTSHHQHDAQPTSSPQLMNHTNFVASQLQNVTPSSKPPTSTPLTTTSTPTTTTTTTTTTSKPDSSHTNQWYNYPHPNLHHNPLLLHHILNKPGVFSQQAGFNQPQDGAGAPQATPIAPPSAPPPLVGPLSALSTNQPSFVQQLAINQQHQRQPTSNIGTNRATTTNTHVVMNNIIEKPTLGGDFMTASPSPINRTQLQMQLNEMRAIAQASNGFKQQLLMQPPALQAQNLIRSDMNSQTQQQHVFNPQQLRNFATETPASIKPLVWPKLSNEPPIPSDFLSHLIGPKTLMNIAMPSNFHPTFATIKPPMRAPTSFHGEESAATIQSNLLPVSSPSPPLQRFANRYPNMNVMHHLFGNNLSGSNLNHPLALNSIALKSRLQQQQQQPPGSFRPLNPINRPALKPLPVNLQAQLNQKQLLDHLMNGGAPISHLHHQQSMFKMPPQLGPKIMTSPSLLQEVYTLRPATTPISTLTASVNQAPTATPCPSRDQYETIRPQLNNQTVRTQQLNELSRSASNLSQKQTSMSDEDMSTYVAQLASLNAQVNQAASPSIDATWLGGNSSSIIPTLDGPLSEFVAILQQQQQQQQQQRTLSNSSQENFELLIQKILDAIGQQAASSNQQSFPVQMQPPPQQQTNNLQEILKSIKLVGLPEEVQAQLYHELGPILQPSHNLSKPLSSPPYSALQLNALSNVLNGNKWLKTNNMDNQLRVEPSSWKRPAHVSQITPIGSTMSDSQNNYYYNIDSHQKKQKKDREEQQQQQQQVLYSELQRQRQRQKQIAFIEALRSSVMKMHDQGGIIDSDLDITSPSKTNASLDDLASLANSIELTNVTTTSNEALPATSGSSLDDFDEQSKDPIPEWLERQIIQESLVHETSRVHPFGHTTKSTIIGSPFRPHQQFPPSGAFLAPPFIARPSAPAAILRPASSQFYPTRLARPIYPLHPIGPLRPNHQLHPLSASAHYNGPVGRLTQVRPIGHHMMLAEGSQPLVNHHSMPFMAPTSTVSTASATSSPQILPPNSFQQQSPQQLQLPMTPVNPTKLLSDRFPFASAPAYLVKLPTLSGGTITASGSLVPPSRLLSNHLQHHHHRPIGPLRFLNSAVSIGPPRIKLMSNMMQSAPSIVHALHQAPAHHYHNSHPATTSYSSGYNQAPSVYSPMFVGHSPRLPEYQAISYQNPHLRPIYGPQQYSANSYHSQPLPSDSLTTTGAQTITAQNQPAAELIATSSAAVTSQFGTSNLPTNRLQINSTSSTTPLSVFSQNISNDQQQQIGINQAPSYSGNIPQAQPVLQQHQQPVNTLAGYQANQDIYVNHPLHHTPIFTPAGITRYQQTSPSLANSQQQGNVGQQSSSPASTLSRLQQATASLVELTSLASLVEEMVGGTDIESSPAVALANAINSLSAAQNAALNTQASTNGLSSSAPTGNSLNDQQQQQPHQQQIGNLNQVNGLFSWKNLLNPMLWRDKSLVKSSTLERLVAARKVPQTRLKVKYIRVPVAVYETSGVNNDGNNNNAGFDSNNNNNNNNNGFSNQNQLVTKTQLAEIIATGANPLGGSSTAATSAVDNLISTGGSSATASAGSAVSTTNQAAIPSATNQLQASGNANQNLPNTISAASSADYLFDELSMDSAPKLALSLANPTKDDDRIEYLPIGLTTLRQPLKVVNKLNPLTGNSLSDLNSLESALYYSLLNPMASSAESAKPASKTPETSSGGVFRKKKKKKSKKGDDEDEESEDEEDDDLFSPNDLPILESLISTVIHGSPHHSINHHPYHPINSHQQMLAASSLSSPIGWRSRSPFGGLRGEASTNIETYAHPSTGLNPFSKHSHRFSLGEVVGAIGVKKLISSLLNKRKISRTNKRDVLQNNNHVSSSTESQKDLNDGIKKKGKFDFLNEREFSRSTEMPFQTSSTTTESVLSTLATPLKYPFDSKLDNSRKKQATNNDSKQSAAGAKRKLNDLVARPVISDASSSNNFTSSQTVVSNNDNNNDKDNKISSKINENHPSKRLEASTNQVIDLTPKEPPIIDQKAQPNLASKTYNKFPMEEQVQFKFLLKSNLQDKQVGADSIKSQTQAKNSNIIDNNTEQADKIEKRKENKMAMPLYHVVADHYNKLHPGRSQKNNSQQQQQHHPQNKSTSVLHDNNNNINRP